jgi:hypothetical protein
MPVGMDTFHGDKEGVAYGFSGIKAQQIHLLFQRASGFNNRNGVQ